MTDDISKRIKLMSLLCTILVIVIHSFNANLSGIIDYNWYIQTLLSGALCRISVPYFFIVSGFLFFYHEKKVMNFQTYSTKIKKRCKNLLLPYICMVIPGALIYILFRHANEQPANWFSTFIALCITPKISYQLWFIRDLFILCIITPILSYIAYNKFTRHVFPLLLLAYPPILWYSRWFQGESLLFFFLGNSLAYHTKKDRILQYLPPISITSLCIALWLFLCCHTLKYNMYYMTLFRNIWGIVAMWWFLGYGLKKLEKMHLCDLFMRISHYNFYIYIFHEPLLTLLRKSFLLIFHKNSSVLLLLYIIIPPLNLLFLYIIYRYIIRKMPFPVTFFSGGRF